MLKDQSSKQNKSKIKSQKRTFIIELKKES